MKTYFQKKKNYREIIPHKKIKVNFKKKITILTYCGNVAGSNR